MFFFLKPKFKLEDREKLVAYSKRASLPLMFNAEKYSDAKLRRVIKHSITVILHIDEGEEWKELRDVILDRLNFLMDIANKKGVKIRISPKKDKIVGWMLVNRQAEIINKKKHKEQPEGPIPEPTREPVPKQSEEQTNDPIDLFKKIPYKTIDFNGFEIGSAYAGPEIIKASLFNISGHLVIKTNSNKVINSLTWIPMKTETEPLSLTSLQIHTLIVEIGKKYGINFMNNFSIVSPYQDQGHLLAFDRDIMFKIDYNQLHSDLDQIFSSNFKTHIEKVFSFQFDIIQNYQEYLKS